MINAAEIIIGENSYISEDVEINVRGKFEIGPCSVIQSGTIINCESFSAGEYLYISKNVEIGRGGSNNPESTIVIGNHVGIFENAIINPNSPISIGNDVGIGCDVMIWTHGAWLDITLGFPADFGPVTIGNDVWIPARCIILPNITIGDNVVIGVNSVVNKSIPSGSLAAGSPCKVLQSNFYPRELNSDQLEIKINEILNYWIGNLVPNKSITTFIKVSYLKNQNQIILVQTLGETFFHITERVMVGFENDVSEDLRDYLRRRGVKFYNGKPFKSIKLKS
jgi:acetyltransferase-like isoleucine patch superfamily enzyme